MQKVLFLFPPFIPGAARGPYLAPHLLTTILRKNGHEVTNLDLNRIFLMKLCSLEVLNKVEKAFHEFLELASDLQARINIQGGIESFDLLRKKIGRNEKISDDELLHYGNYIKSYLLSDVKTITDYRDKGLHLHPCIKEEFDKLIRELDLTDKTVCMSCAFGDQLAFTLEIARLIKTTSPSTKIILGGAQISLLPQELIAQIERMKLFNVVFTGFAEEKISEVIQNCPDTYFREPVNGTTATHKLLDSLPITQFDSMELYENPFIPVIVNKGCYWGKCTFCDYILMGDLGGARYVSRSVDVVFNEIKEYRKIYPNFDVNLISDAVPPKFYKELCLRANAEDFPLKTHSYMINNKNLTEDFFKEAARARINIIIFGTESTSDRVLELMQKQGRRRDILENLRNAQKYGLRVKVNLIPNYPTTTYKEALQTIKDISIFTDVIAKLAVFKFYLSANTAMDQNPEDFELDVKSDIPYLKTAHNGFHSRDFVNRKGMNPDEERAVFATLYNMSFNLTLKKARSDFQKLFNPSDIKKLSPSKDFSVFQIDNAVKIYSLKKGAVFSIPAEQAGDMKRLKSSTNPQEIEEILKTKPVEWLEHFYSLGILEFAKTG